MLEIGIFSAFIAGILSFTSPCVLPLVPVYIDKNYRVFNSSRSIFGFAGVKFYYFHITIKMNL